MYQKVLKMGLIITTLLFCVSPFINNQDKNNITLDDSIYKFEYNSFSGGDIGEPGGW